MKEATPTDESKDRPDRRRTLRVIQAGAALVSAIAALARLIVDFCGR
jgi:hypothetical protein